MSASLGEVFERRELLYLLAWREIRIKYKQSVMGMLWAVLMPAVIVSAGVVVRYGVAVVSGVPLQPGDVAAVTQMTRPMMSRYRAILLTRVATWRTSSTVAPVPRATTSRPRSLKVAY